MTHLNAAQLAHAGMNDPAATQQMRDEAAVRYGRETALLFDAMSLLQQAGATGVITSLLCKRGRA